MFFTNLTHMSIYYVYFLVPFIAFPLTKGKCGFLAAPVAFNLCIRLAVVSADV